MDKDLNPDIPDNNNKNNSLNNEFEILNSNNEFEIVINKELREGKNENKDDMNIISENKNNEAVIASLRETIINYQKSYINLLQHYLQIPQKSQKDIQEKVLVLQEQWPLQKNLSEYQVFLLPQIRTYEKRLLEMESQLKTQQNR